MIVYSNANYIDSKSLAVWCCLVVVVVANTKWVILKTYVSWALHSKRYETRLNKTVEVCNVLLISDVISEGLYVCPKRYETRLNKT